MKASKRLLKERAKQALITESNRKYNGMCDPVCVEFCRLTEKIGYPTKGLARVSFLGKEPHYVAVMDGEDLSFAQSNTLVIIDPTIRQFDDLIEQNCDEIEFVKSTDDKWEYWYPEFELISDRRVREFREEMNE